jgi:DNA polymerase II large subunit
MAISVQIANVLAGWPDAYSNLGKFLNQKIRFCSIGKNKYAVLPLVLSGKSL